MRERNEKKGKRKGGETRERGKDEKEKRRTAYLEREKKKEKIYKREKKKRERFFLSYFRMTNPANSTKISNSPLSRGTPAVLQLLPSLPHRLFPPRPLPLACVLLRCVLPVSLKKKNFRFLKFFLLKSHRLRLCSNTLTRRRLSLGLLADIPHPRSRFARDEACRKNLSLALLRRSYVWTRFCN